MHSQISVHQPDAMVSRKHHYKSCIFNKPCNAEEFEFQGQLSKIKITKVMMVVVCDLIILRESQTSSACTSNSSLQTEGST